MLGPHVDFNGDFKYLIKIHEIINNELFQIFKIPNKQIKNFDIFKKYMKINKIKLYIHGSYTINIAEDWINNYSGTRLIEEINFANKVKASGLVIHLGKSKNLTESNALNNMLSTLLLAHNKTKNNKHNVPILLETPAGQGSEMCYNLEKFADFYKKISKISDLSNRIKICVDTCHIFSAGYDLRTSRLVKKYFKKFDELIGIKNIYLIHLNDSKVPLGQRVDRHEILGKGYIGIIGLKTVYKLCKHYNIPIVIETYNKYTIELPKLVK
ncbi:apurinic endonuclease [Hokovirus HKV1]|uniref:Apurinic endonuclease n=1 Tax=Hokovirus HKV1 TaxID=1977638 RepID=A0A1V0SFR4_9VIRU|nr:apurinic endonuclease [Hokovirus HKV1]